MLRFCSLLLFALASVSVSSFAAGTDKRDGSPFRSLASARGSYDPAWTSYEGPYIAQSTAISSMAAAPFVSHGRFSLFGTMDATWGGCDRKTLTCRVSDELVAGKVMNHLGHGGGITYAYSRDTVVSVAILHTHAMDVPFSVNERLAMIVLSKTF